MQTIKYSCNNNYVKVCAAWRMTTAMESLQKRTEEKTSRLLHIQVTQQQYRNLPSLARECNRPTTFSLRSSQKNNETCRAPCTYTVAWPLNLPYIMCVCTRRNFSPLRDLFFFVYTMLEMNMYASKIFSQRSSSRASDIEVFSSLVYTQRV